MRRREFLKRGAVLGTAVTGAGSVACSEQQGAVRIPSGALPTAGMGHDLALVNAKILTLDTPQPEAEAVLVRGGRIAVVGSTDQVRAQAGSTPVLDAGGRVVVPGFIDAHVHFEYTCLWHAYQVDCHTPPHENISDVLGALRAKAAETAPGRWVIGRGGGLPNGFAEKRMPTREEMDTVSETHPVLLLSFMHVGIMNTRGLRELGLWDATAVNKMRWPGGKPRVGSVVHRDTSGTPTGVVTEMWDLLPPYTLEEIRAAVKEHAEPQFLSKGITSVTTMPFHADELRATHELHAAGELPLRTRVFYQAPHTISVDGFFDSALVPGFGDDMLRFGGLKVFVTGIFSDGLGNRVEDYKWTQEELNEVVYRAHVVGIPVAMHTSGGAEPIERALTAVEAAQRRHAKPVRHRLEHASRLSDPDHVRRIRKLGMRVTITRAQRGILGRTGGSPWKTFVREGIEPIAISDTTGSVPEFSPLDGIASLVASPGEGGATPPGESVTFEEALRMWTLWAARGNSEERDKGSISVGKLGDFAVLSDDPRSRDGAEIFDINVDTTILGGNVVFERSPT